MLLFLEMKLLHDYYDNDVLVI